MENFWYYYKWYLLGGIFLIVTLLVAIHSCANKEETDLYLLCSGQSAPSPMQTQQLEEFFAEKITDPKEEEPANVTIVTAATVDQWNGSNSAAMLVQVNSGKMVLYVLDDTTYKILHDNGLLQDLSFAGESEFLEEDRYLLSASGALNELESLKEDPTQYYLCIRKVEGTTLEENPHYIEQEKLSKEIMKKMVASK